MLEGKNILLVESDGVLRESLVEQLKLQDLAAIAVKTGGQALAKLEERQFDLLIVDASLPDIEGLELGFRMRRENAKVPIIMLVGAETEIDKNVGWGAGPNDYVTKPFRLGYLLARIQFLLGKPERGPAAKYTLGPYNFNPAAKLLLEPKENKIIRLTEKETSILKYLILAANTFVGRDKLLNEVWGYNSGVTTHTLETHVYRLRRKLEPDPSRARILVTEPGGYRLIP